MAKSFRKPGQGKKFDPQSTTKPTTNVEKRSAKASKQEAVAEGRQKQNRKG